VKCGKAVPEFRDLPLKTRRRAADNASGMADRQRTVRGVEGQGLCRSIAPSDFLASHSLSERATGNGIELHVCPRCNSALVYPRTWAPVAPRRWQVELRCPECEWSGSGIYAQSVVDRLDRALDAGTESVLEDLHLLVRANLEERAEAFIAALRADEILPEDF
jgi:hypothetical protein